MKKQLMIVVASFLALLTGCSKESLETKTMGKRTYQFETSIGGAKHAKGMPKATWKMGDVMALYGLNVPVFAAGEVIEDADWTFKDSQHANGRMTPMFCYDPNPAGQVWSYGAPVAWYDGVNTSFIAIYPYTAAEYEGGLNNMPNLAAEIDIDYAVVGGYAAGADAATIAIARGKIKTQTDLLVALTRDLDNTATSIPLNFGHALSQIRFNVTNASKTSTDLLRVEDITVSDINTKGNFVVVTDAQNTDLPTFEKWTAQSELQTFKVNLRSENVNAIKAGRTVEAIDYDDEALIMIPQMLPATAAITITYSSSPDAGLSWSGASESSTLLVNFKDKLEPNKRYTFNVTITPSSNTVSFKAPEIDEWN